MEELAVNYATSLYQLAEPSRREDYRIALRDFASAIKEDETLSRALSSYAIPTEEKEKLLHALLASYSLPYLENFGKVILSHHRLRFLPSIVEAFESLLNEEEGVKEGVLYSSSPLSKKEVESIEEAFQKRLGCKVRLKPRVDEALLGGVKVALDGKVYDGSLRNRLLELHKTLK